MKLGTTTDDEPDIGPLIRWFFYSLITGWITGYVATDVLKELGYTNQITAEVIGGGGSTTIYPIAAEWYGGMISAGIFALMLSALVIWGSWKDE